MKQSRNASLTPVIRLRWQSWGIYSLSKNLFHAPKWTHYADSHRGFCIEYDLNLLLEQSLQNEFVVEVHYVDCVPTLTVEDVLAVKQNPARVAQAPEKVIYGGRMQEGGEAVGNVGADALLCRVEYVEVILETDVIRVERGGVDNVCHYAAAFFL